MPALPVHRRIPTDVVLPIACGAAALVVYLWTLQPGLGGPEDTPKFQCLGYVLGTAHPPGYPLYLLLTFLATHIPIGSIAWRANAFSAVCGAVSVAFVWSAARQLGTSRLAATGAALSLAFTAYFWWNAILAEVYTLGTAFEAVLLFFLLRWQRTRQVRDLHVAVGAAAFALANHLTIVALAPACLLFALAVDWRQALRPRTIAVNLLLGIAGLSTYSYILIRTWMRGAHLESRANNLAELFTIMRASRFSGSIGFTARELFGHRFPDVAVELLGQAGVAGTMLAIGGLAFLAWRNWRAALLAGGALFGALLLAADVAADIKGFLMPALVLTWLLSAAGVEVVQRALTTLAGARTARVAAALLAAFVAGHLLARNYESNNLRDNTFEARFFDALFERLPAGTAFVAENYVVDSLVRCQLIMTGPASQDLGRMIQYSPAAIRAMKSSGHGVVAFKGGANAAMFGGYRVSPIVVRDTSLREWIDALPPRSVIIIAAAQRTLPADLGSRKGRGALAWRAAQGLPHHVIVVAPGGWESAEFTSTDAPLDRRFAAGSVIGGAGPLASDVHAVAAGDRAAISVRGRQVASVYDGLVVVAVGSDGKVVGDWTYPSGAPLDVPFDRPRWSIFEVAEERACRAVGDGAWHDVSALARQGALFVRFDNARPATARLTLYVAADDEPWPAVLAQFGSRPPTVEQRIFDRTLAEDAAALAHALRDDGVQSTPMLQDTRFVARFSLAVQDRGQQAYAAAYLGGRPVRVFARGSNDRMTAPRVLVCEQALPPVMGSSPTPVSRLPLGAATPFYFGAGWRKPERTDDVSEPHRWTTKPRARLALPVDVPAAVQVQLRLRPAPGVTTIVAELNGHRLPARSLSADWQGVSWETDASMWQKGLNDLTLVTDRVHVPDHGDPDSRVRGVKVASIEFLRISEP